MSQCSICKQPLPEGVTRVVCMKEACIQAHVSEQARKSRISEELDRKLLTSLDEVWDAQHEQLVIQLRMLRGLKQLTGGAFTYDQPIKITENAIRMHIREQAYMYDPYSEDPLMQEFGKLPNIAVAWFVRGVVSTYLQIPVETSWGELPPEEQLKWSHIAEHFTYFFRKHAKAFLGASVPTSPIDAAFPERDA